MSIGTADFQKATVTAWNASGLNELFIALGTTAPVLFDQEAPPKKSYPYCILDQPSIDVESRMTASSGKYHIKSMSQNFRLFVGEVSGDTRTAKELAAYLAEEIMKVFGGHPTVSPTATISLDNGNHLITQYVNDFALRIGDGEYEWDLTYTFLLDVPVMV